MSKLFFVALFIVILSFVSPVKANTKLCSEVNSQISRLDKHADDFYSYASYQFDDKPLLKKLRANTKRFKDRSFEKALDSAERAIESDDKDLMMKIAPVSRYLNEWNSEHCS